MVGLAGLAAGSANNSVGCGLCEGCSFSDVVCSLSVGWWFIWLPVLFWLGLEVWSVCFVSLDLVPIPVVGGEGVVVDWALLSSPPLGGWGEASSLLLCLAVIIC